MDWPETLGSNLAIAGALCRSHRLGAHSCTGDWGPRGDEWYPGEGHSPEDIKDRRWNHEPHKYLGDGNGRCQECGEDDKSYLHYVAGEPCPECQTTIEHDGNCEACNAKWEAEHPPSHPPSPALVALFSKP